MHAQYDKIKRAPLAYPSRKTVHSRLDSEQPDKLVNEIIEDTNEWKLVVPEVFRGANIRENTLE